VIDLSQISLSISIGTLLALLFAVAKAAARFGALDTKVDTMWQFQMRRAMAEVVSTGMGTSNSPITFTPEALAHLEPLRPQLEDFWATLAPNTSDGEALLAIERHFGDELVRGVCIPCKMSHGACLLMALTIAKQSSDIRL
jgi:hypothetical protein